MYKLFNGVHELVPNTFQHYSYAKLFCFLHYNNVVIERQQTTEMHFSSYAVNISASTTLNRI